MKVSKAKIENLQFVPSDKSVYNQPVSLMEPTATTLESYKNIASIDKEVQELILDEVSK